MSLPPTLPPFLTPSIHTPLFDSLRSSQSCLSFHTTTDYTCQEVHDIGLAEVSRITSEMEKIAAEEGYDSLDEVRANDVTDNSSVVSNIMNPPSFATGFARRSTRPTSRRHLSSSRSRRRPFSPNTGTSARASPRSY